LLTLQRTAGNRAVTQLVGAARRPARVLQRFVGWEHQLLGDKGSMAMCRGNDPAQCRKSPILIEVSPGVKLTWGQVTALAGDEFETVQELKYYAAAAGPKGDDDDDDETRGRLRAAMHHDMDDRPSGSTGIPTGLYDGGAAARKANESHFTDLAFNNLDHFPNEGRAREAWKHHHDMAITQAVHAGLGEAAYSLNDAYLYEAFGDHFLTDSFSAGHIRTPRSDIVSWYEINWAPWARQNFKSWLVIEALKRGVPVDTLVALLKRFGKTVEDLVRIAIAEITPAVAGAVSGTIHDYEGAHGVEVTAPVLGVQFTTWGDDSLPGARGQPVGQTSDIAQGLAIAAIGTARNHLEIAYEIGQSVAHSGGNISDVYGQLRKRGIDWPYDDVWKFVPQAVPGANPTPWAHWRWGQMDPWFFDQVNAYARGKISSRRADVVNSLPAVTLQINDNPPFELRRVVDDALKTFAADPLGAIGNLIMWPALDQRYAPAQPANP
jgi:hypothetical protein